MKYAIVLHHSGDPSADPQYQKVWDYHNSGAGGKWPPGYGMQYHYFIGKDGTIKQARPEDSIGWQAGSWHWNLYSIGICCAGDFTQQSPTDPQINSLAALTKDIQDRWGMPDTKIYLHKEVRPEPTACPGTDLRARLLSRRMTLDKNQIAQILSALPHLQPPRSTIAKRVLTYLQNVVYGSQTAE